MRDLGPDSMISIDRIRIWSVADVGHRPDIHGVRRWTTAMWMLVGGSFLSVACSAESTGPGDGARMERRLDRASVHFHLTLRVALDGPEGPEIARRLDRARASKREAAALAFELFEGRDAGERKLREGGRVSSTITSRLVVEPTIDRESDRAAFFLALSAQAVEDDGRVPRQVLVYEASRLRLQAVSDPALGALARGVAAVTFASVGYCERAVAEADAMTSLDHAAIDLALERWAPRADLERARVHADLGRATRVLAGAARACCAIRSGDRGRAARSVAEWVDDAEQLGIDPRRVAILRAWRALVEGEDVEAREQLEGIAPSTLTRGDAERYRLVRDSLAGSGGAGDPTGRMIDRRWISHLVLAGVFHAFEADGAISAIREHPEAEALRRVAAGEAAVIEAARARYPMFDQAHHESMGTWDRITMLFE